MWAMLPPSESKGRLLFSLTHVFLYKVPSGGLAGGWGGERACATKSRGSGLQPARAGHFPSDLTPPGNWPPSASDSSAYLVIYWVPVKIKWVKIPLFKQQGKGHQKGVHFISPVLMKSSMK